MLFSTGASTSIYRDKTHVQYTLHINRVKWIERKSVYQGREDKTAATTTRLQRLCQCDHRTHYSVTVVSFSIAACSLNSSLQWEEK